jgi:hypothetical protein
VLWLAAQVFFLCLVSFLAGAGITVLALRQKPTRQNEEAPVTEGLDESLTEPQDIEQPREAAEPEPQQEPMVIKASKKSMRYHTPDSPYYNRVSASLTFISPQEAELAGYTAWNADRVKAPAP